MTQNIKNNLFRFVTLRNPQLIDDADKDLGFVYHPSQSSSKFYKAVAGLSPEAVPAALKAAAAEFSAMKSRTDVKKVSPTLYKFSSWLMRNKNAMIYTELRDAISDVVGLTSAQELLVWENLLYQTYDKSDVYIREGLIQLLVANKFFEGFKKFSQGVSGDITFTEDQEKEFVRRAHAAVVVSKSLFEGGSVATKPVGKADVLDRLSEKALVQDLDREFAKEDVALYSGLLDELRGVELTHRKETETAYNEALSGYNKEVEERLKEARVVPVEEVDLVTGKPITIDTYPDLELPKFDYKEDNPVSEKYLAQKLPKDSVDLMRRLNLTDHDDFGKVYTDLNAKIKVENQKAIDNAPRQAKTLNIGGASMSLAGPNTALYAYVMRAYPIYLNWQNLRLRMNVNLGDGKYVTNAEYKATIAGTDYTGTQVQLQSTITGNSLITFFNNGLGIPSGVSTFLFSGKLTLNDGTVLNFSKQFVIKAGNNTGYLTLASVDDNDAVPTYGITNLGIADFRRVEQEVCCYVPGEVSHIENVMAREYKERSTRSLVSSEVTTERTEERERENLTDTTTTERNEMQSEVSSVLNEDKSKNYGASAYVSGEFAKVKFGADAYADFSSSSSASNSNSQAQTYAQEVTERAMERIVQKTQTKRTSRILKEFEENNSHGFDNRKGDKHVTGVYRWVDKIYKNKLINYGKRLMYEFAIPEPARFLKDALIKKEEQGQIETGVILPVAPQKPTTFGLNSAGNIQEYNYQGFAAHYGADVEAPIDRYIKIGKSFAKDDQSYHAKGYAFNDIDVPEGYVGTYATVQWGVIHKNNNNKWMSIAVGDSRHTVIGGTGSTSFYNFQGRYKKNIPFSFGTWEVHSGHFSVTVNCERSEEAFKQWQNETYNAIMDAYERRLQEYNEAMVANTIIPETEVKLKFNPTFNRSLERKELKRIAIELMMDQNQVSRNNYIGDSLVKVNNNEAFQKHAATVKFFEQAFEWDIMAYALYPYFYAKQDDWKSLFQEMDAADPLFQAFLQSGMARTVVPVRSGFEQAVNWFMETGEIWNGNGLVIDMENDLYLSIAEELQTVDGEVESTWETRIPTSLTVVQAGTIGLNVEGLPCDTDCEHEGFDSDNNPIVQTDTQIGGDHDDERFIENIDIVNGNLQLNTDDSPRQTVAQISIQSLKNAIDSIA